MRRFSRFLLLASLLAVSAPALSQGGPPPRRPLKQFANQGPLRPAETGIKPMGFLVLALIGGGMFLVMVVWYKRQAQDLGLPADEEALAESAPRGDLGVSPREVVFAAVSRAAGWVTPGRVALSAAMPAEEVQTFLDELIRDGRIKAGRDKQGRVLYRTLS